MAKSSAILTPFFVSLLCFPFHPPVITWGSGCPNQNLTSAYATRGAHSAISAPPHLVLNALQVPWFQPLNARDPAISISWFASGFPSVGLTGGHRMQWSIREGHRHQQGAPQLVVWVAGVPGVRGEWGCRPREVSASYPDVTPTPRKCRQPLHQKVKKIPPKMCRLVTFFFATKSTFLSKNGAQLDFCLKSTPPKYAALPKPPLVLPPPPQITPH